MPATTNILAVDLGASSGRVLLGRWDGARFSLGEVHRFPNRQVAIGTHQYWNILGLWNEICAGLARYAADVGEPLAGLGVDTWGVDYALLDRNGNLIDNPITYRDDRTIGMIDAVAKQIGPAQVFERTGIQVLPFNTLYQVYSMAQAHDPRLERASTMLMIPDLLHYWMTGSKAVEYTNASTTQMLDCRTHTWANDMLDRLGIPSTMLPDLIAPGSALGPLRSSVAAAAGLRGTVPVIAPATHDTASAVAAIPGLDNRSAYISSGTWSLIGVERPTPITDARARALNVTNEGGVANTVRLLKNVAGMWLLEECRRVWQLHGRGYAWDELQHAALNSRPFAALVNPDHPTLLNPPDMPAALRALCTQTGQNAPQSVGEHVRCCLESLALAYRLVIDGMEALVGEPIEVVRVVGGGSQNRLLCQWTADACGRTVVAGPAEATALGNMLVQAIAAGHIRDIGEGRAAIAASFEPQTYYPRDTDRWNEALQRFSRLMPQTA